MDAMGAGAGGGVTDGRTGEEGAGDGLPDLSQLAGPDDSGGPAGAGAPEESGVAAGAGAPDEPALEEAAPAEPATSDDNVVIIEQPDGGVEIIAMETDDEGNVTVVEVDIDADGDMHGEVVEVAADGHVIGAEALEITEDGDITVVEIDVDSDGAPEGHHDEVAQADGDADLVFDTDDYAPDDTPPADDASSDE